MQPKSFSLDGKRYRIDPLIPMATIRHWVSMRHIGASDSYIEREIAESAARSKDGAQWTPSRVRQAQRYAVSCHRKNQALYTRVTKGN
jgi:hypothetical protein